MEEEKYINKAQGMFDLISDTLFRGWSTIFTQHMIAEKIQADGGPFHGGIIDLTLLLLL